jgi:hypothetical protein
VPFAMLIDSKHKVNRKINRLTLAESLKKATAAGRLLDYHVAQ